jgi:RecA-family ATPase
LNFKVFPGTYTRDGRKVPLISGWQEKATTDKAQIDKWTQQFGDRIKFWSIPTGKPTNTLVLDVDVKNGDGFESLKPFGVPETLSQTTPSGGKHYIFKYPDDGFDYGNSVGFLPNLDSRGNGGYIGYYGDINDLPISEAPPWFLDHLKKRKTRDESQPVSTHKIAQPIADKKLADALELIRNAPPGESNNVLNAQSYVAGQLIASNNFTKDHVYEQLMQAARDRGKPEYEAKATIHSGVSNGVSHPSHCPFSSEPPKLLIETKSTVSDVPLPPKEIESWTPSYLSIFDLTNTCKLKKPQLFKDWSTEDIHLTTADGGTGKTTLKLYEAICLALGERFLGFLPEQRGKTLFITGEDSDKKLAAILGQICEQMGLYKGTEESNKKLNTVLKSIVIKKDDNLALMIKNSQGMLEINESAYDNIINAVHEIGPKMIVFDPIAAFWGPEAMVNDMTKVVAKFMGRLVNDSNTCVEMINHMGKSSSNSKDMTQFAGRGGTALPSHSRVSRVLRAVDDNEYKELTGLDLKKEESAILCNVNKFSDGSPLLNEPFLIIRNGYIFTKTAINKALVDNDNPDNDAEKIFNYVKGERNKGEYPIKPIIEFHFTAGSKMTKTRVNQTLKNLQYRGIKGQKLREIDNPDPSIKDKAYIIINADGGES